MSHSFAERNEIYRVGIGMMDASLLHSIMKRDGLQVLSVFIQEHYLKKMGIYQSHPPHTTAKMRSYNKNGIFSLWSQVSTVMMEMKFAGIYLQ